MRLKSFNAPTLAAAMEQVRDALGDEAIIIATRDNDDGTVQITAALDETPATGAPAAALTPLDSAIMEDDALDQIADALQKHGTPVMLSESIIAHAARVFTGDLTAALAAGLAATCTFAEAPDKANKTLVMVGPPGAGKTAMIGKLAARNAIAGRRTAAISTDLERAGGVAQLAAYTQSLRIPLMEVEDPGALRDAMGLHADVDLLLIDCTGINPFDPRAVAQTQSVVKQAQGTNILVLPAGLEVLDAAELTAAFKALGATHLLPTRLDLARRLGSLLAIAAESGLALSVASGSPAIAAGLEILTPETLAARILGKALPQQATAPELASQTTTSAASPAPKSATHGKR